MRGVKQKRMWGKPWITGGMLAVMALVSAGASAGAKLSDLPSPLQLGHGWFFHVSFAVVVFLVIYALCALLTATMRSGGPPSKMAGLGFSLEWEKAVEAANSGVASLEELNKRVSGLQKQIATLAAAERDTQEALVRIADALPAAEGLAATARMQSERLAGLLGDDIVRADKATEAIAAFRANLATLERLHQEMSNG